MTTRELIELLQQLDPEGAMPVVNYEAGDEYHEWEVTVADMRLHTDGHYYDWRAGKDLGERIVAVTL